MSQVYIPEPLTVPALWEPWRKPYSPVSVNMDHPLARGLKVYTLGGRNLLNAPRLINNSVPSKGVTLTLLVSLANIFQWAIVFCIARIFSCISSAN